MGRKSKKQLAYEALAALSDADLREILGKFKLGSKNNSFESVENVLKKACPHCLSINTNKKGKNKIGLTIYLCKDCGRRFNILSQTPLEKTQYEWTVWVSILEQMLKNQSIEKITDHLIATRIVKDINFSTVSMMEHKLRNSFINMPLPDLKGVIQCDEKHFKESQKGFKDPKDVLDPTGKKRRKGHKRSVPSKYGTMGPEFSTICCALDSSGHSLAKVLTMGHMTVELFEYEIAPHFRDVTFLCSDMNSVYTQYGSIHKVPQYVCNSNYHKVMKKCNTKAKKVAAYEVDKLDYIAGVGVFHYDHMVKLKKTHKLTINGVNGYHAELERYINHIAKGVSTKHLQAWVSFFYYRWNFRIDNGHAPTTYVDAERILIEIIKRRSPIKVNDVKYQIDITKKNTKRYTKQFITRTVATRVKSNDPHLKFTEEDGVWVVDKRKSVVRLPEYKRRNLAKAMGIRPYSPTSVSSDDLIKMLIANPKLEEHLYILANGKTEI